jgi:hypothetical protein
MAVDSPKTCQYEDVMTSLQKSDGINLKQFDFQGSQFVKTRKFVVHNNVTFICRRDDAIEHGEHVAMSRCRVERRGSASGKD